jgi:hypothetical protein
VLEAVVLDEDEEPQPASVPTVIAAMSAIASFFFMLPS